MKNKPTFKSSLEQFRINQLYENVESGEINHIRGFKRSDCYYIADDRNCAGHEMDKNRPGVIVSNNEINSNNSVLLVAYFTTKPQTEGPTHVKSTVTGKPSTILVEQVQAVSVERFGTYKGTMSFAEMEKVDAALANVFGLDELYKKLIEPSPSEDTCKNAEIDTDTNEQEQMIPYTDYKACKDELQLKEQELLTANTQLMMMQNMYNQLLERMMNK